MLKHKIGRKILKTFLIVYVFQIGLIETQITNKEEFQKYQNHTQTIIIRKNGQTLLPETPPEFINPKRLPNTLVRNSGSFIRLTCLANGYPTPNITWTRNGKEIERLIGKVSYEKWSLEMDDIISQDSGVYQCNVCNHLGCIQHATDVKVMDRYPTRPLMSEKFPANKTVITNSSTYLECRVISDLEPYIFWIKHKGFMKNMEQVAEQYLNNNKNDSIFTEKYTILHGNPETPNILNFTNITQDDEGWYTCVAATTLGLSKASAYLEVVDNLIADNAVEENYNIIIIIGSIVVILILVLGFIYGIYVRCKYKLLLDQPLETVHQWTKVIIVHKPFNSDSNFEDFQIPLIKIEKQRTTITNNSYLNTTPDFNEYEFPLDSKWEIERSNVSLGPTLGEGAFGRVVMAQVNSLPPACGIYVLPSTVALKMVKEEHTDADVTSLVREMEIMKMIGKHINIINLLGCCSQNGPLWVIVEYAEHGNLKDFLKKHQSLCVNEYMNHNMQLSEKHLISFAFQIARGMEYLASKRCIHRDLAARNVLVSTNYIMKIADFGLARDIQDTNYYRKNTKGILPIKWMAPESLKNLYFDSQSDVWSYGILLWEIMTYGEQPYPHIMSFNELYNFLKTGQRLEQPPHCPLNIYKLMQECWHFDSSDRPTFRKIVENLDGILELMIGEMTNDQYLTLYKTMDTMLPSSNEEFVDELNHRNSLKRQNIFLSE